MKRITGIALAATAILGTMYMEATEAAIRTSDSIAVYDCEAMDGKTAATTGAKITTYIGVNEQEGLNIQIQGFTGKGANRTPWMQRFTFVQPRSTGGFINLIGENRSGAEIFTSMSSNNEPKKSFQLLYNAQFVYHCTFSVDQQLVNYR